MANYICQMSRKSKGKMVTKMKPSSRKNQGFGFAPLDKNISKILKPIFFKKKDDFLIINNLQKNWQNIVGEKCWQFCVPKKIKFEKNKKANGVLNIGAGNSSVAFYLEANSNQIIQNIAAYYGYKIVGEIRILQEPKILQMEEERAEYKISAEQENFIAQSTTIIKDEGLKSVLQQLGKSIFKQT